MAAPNKPDDKNKADNAGASSDEAPAVAANHAMQSAADQNLEDSRGRTFGDTTSSMGGKNNPGQHGRDGGQSVATDHPQDFDHNPAPSEAAADPSVAEDEREAQQEDNADKGPRVL